MSGRMRRCPVDGTYTLSHRCPVCGGATRTAHPARFSPEDRLGHFRRIGKKWKIS